MAGPYTTFDYGDPAAINVSAPPYIAFIRSGPFLFGDPSSNPADTPFPVAADLLGGTTGIAYTETISAVGGVSPYTFAVTSGSLPTSTSLNSTTGVISGTPSVAGSYTFTITVTDNVGNTGSYAFTIVIAAPSASGGGGASVFAC